MLRTKIISAEIECLINADKKISIVDRDERFNSSIVIENENNKNKEVNSKLIVSFSDTCEIDRVIEKLELLKFQMMDPSNITIEEMQFSVRVYNCLKRAGINYKSELEERRVEDLSKIRNLGKLGIREIMGRPDVKLAK